MIKCHLWIDIYKSKVKNLRDKQLVTHNKTDQNDFFRQDSTSLKGKIMCKILLVITVTKNKIDFIK